MKTTSTLLAFPLLVFALAARAAGAIDFTDAVLLRDDSITNLTSATINDWPLLEESLRFSFQTEDTSRAVWMGGNRDHRHLDVRALGFPVYEAQAAFHPQTVDKGEPLLWSIPGHTRLIVGYNEKASRILYSDSWGAGHERKEMSAAEAVLMTQICFAVHP